MQKDTNRKVADLTVGEFRSLTNESIKSVIKWGFLFFYGLPVLVLVLLAVFGYVMVTLADKA